MQENLFIDSEVLTSRLHLHIAWRKCRVQAVKQMKEPLCDSAPDSTPRTLTSFQAFQPHEIQCTVPSSPTDLYRALVTYNS